MCSTTIIPIPLLLLLALCSQAQCSCINPPCTAVELETSALQNPSQLELHFRELRIFPFLNFSYHGNITKWTLLAAKGSGQGRPQLSIWRQISATRYRKVAADLMNPCVIKRISTLDFGDVFVHENVPSEPLSFQPGDILGLLLRGAHAAGYIPFLRNNSRVVANLPLSYYTPRLGSREADVFSIRQKNSDTFVPVSSFEICVSEDDANTEHPLCTSSQQQQQERTCLDVNAAVMPTSPVIPSPSPSISVKAASATGISSPSPSVSVNAPSANLFSTGLLTASIVVPLCVLVIVLTACIITAVNYCVSRRAKVAEGHHMMFTTKPFSEINTMTEVRYSPPNKPLPSPPPSPPFHKTDLEPVYEVIA